ncbi:MAG TPA: hypothetical protein VIK50_07400 [Gemmatimonadaceae bacterium]
MRADVSPALFQAGIVAALLLNARYAAAQDPGVMACASSLKPATISARS